MVNAPLIAIEDFGDWMRVRLAPPDATPEIIEALWASYVLAADGGGEEEEGPLWVLRQQGDMIYLVSGPLLPSCCLRRKSQKGKINLSWRGVLLGVTIDVKSHVASCVRAGKKLIKNK